MAHQGFVEKDYYSLLELVDKLGKQGTSQLLKKARPRRVNHEDMVYFHHQDIDQALENTGLIESKTAEQDVLSRFYFYQTLIKRYKVGKDEVIYEGKPLDLRDEVVYGRTEGDPRDVEHLRVCGVISSLHGRLYLDEENSLLYQNVGSNRSKLRGPQDDRYNILEENEIGVLISREMFQELFEYNEQLQASIKLGFQVKPHFIVRVQAVKK